MHNLRKIKKKKKVSMVNSEEQAQEKLFEISRFDNEEQSISEVDRFIERLQPKEVNPETARPSRSRIFQQQCRMTNFINEFDRSRMESRYLSSNEMRSHSSDLIDKKPISISRSPLTQLTICWSTNARTRRRSTSGADSML